MSWVTILWSVVAAACLTLAALSLLIWFNKRAAWGHLFFSVAAVSNAGLALCELGMMKADTTAGFGLAVRWLHVAAWGIVVAIICFVWFHLRAGRWWLGWITCVLRTVSLALNFLTGENLNFRTVTVLHHDLLLGEPVAIGGGVANPWMLVGQFSLILFLIFAADASITVWRRGDRRLALLVGGGIVFFVLLGTVQSVLVLWQLVRMPYAASLFFMGIIVAVAYELSRDLLHAEKLSSDLRESEERMILATEAAGLGLWIRDLTGNEIWASKHWRLLFDFAPEEKLDLDRVLHRLHSDDRKIFQHALARAIEGEGHYETEFRVLLPNGRVRWIASYGRIEFDPPGKATRARGVSADITTRKRSEERLRLVVEASPNGIVLTNGDGRMVLVNATMEKFFGYTREEMIGQPVELLIPEAVRGKHPGHRTEFHVAPEARAMGAGRELFACRKDGTSFPVEIGLNPIHSSDGLLVLAVIVDITARKAAESEAAQLRNELTHITRVSMMGQLASSLAHELNQPLGAILRNAEAAELFLQHPSPDLDELRAILEDIRKDDQRAGAVIHRMRSFLQRHDVERNSVDLNELVSEVIGLVRPDAELRHVRMDFVPLSALTPVQGDRIQLQQVLLNLLLNALDAVHEGDKPVRRITVSIQQESGLIEIGVRDTGHGIPAKIFASLFEPFFTTKSKGMGMGLSISRTIVEAHGGRLWAENNAEGGATFRFSLPMGGAEGTADAGK